MFWFAVIAVVGFVGFKFFFSLHKDNDDLQNRTLADKFQTIVNMVNEAAFGGLGKVTVLDKREFNLYKEDENQIIKFQYSTGILTVIWKYKYFQKEVVHERQFDNARNLSIFEQQRMGQALINEMIAIVAQHKAQVIAPLEAELLSYNPAISLINTPIKDNSIANIILNDSTTFDVIDTFGPNFSTTNYGDFSGQIIYSDLGLTFHHKLSDVTHTIFKIDAEYPFKGYTEDKFRVDITTLGDIINNYGEPKSMNCTGSKIYYTVNNVHYGIEVNLEDFGPNGFAYENNLGSIICRIMIL